MECVSSWTSKTLCGSAIVVGELQIEFGKRGGIAGKEIKPVSSKLKCHIITRMINERFCQIIIVSPPRCKLQSHTCRINGQIHNALNLANN